MNEYGKEVAKKMEDYMNEPDSVDREIHDIQNAEVGVKVRGALAAGVKKSFDISKSAKQIAEETSAKQNALEQQFDDQIANMTLEDPSSAELIAARTNAKTGENWSTIGRRLDDEHERLLSQLVQTAQDLDSKKANFDDLIVTERRIDEVAQRIDQIITTPADDVSAQEIIDARQGEPSLGANLTQIKKRLGLLNTTFTNFVVNGNFETGEGWTANSAINTVENNTLINTGNGAGRIPFVRRTTGIALDTIKKVYIKAKVQVTNSYATHIRFGAVNSQNEFIGGVDFNYTPWEWHDISLVVTTKENDSGNLGIIIQHYYPDAETANGKSIKVQYVLGINLTEVFGLGYEPTKEDMDAMLDHFQNRWFDGTIGAEKTQIPIFQYMLNSSDIPFKIETVNQEITKIKQDIASVKSLDLNDHNKEIWFDFENELWQPFIEGQVTVDTENVRFGSQGMKLTKIDSNAVYAERTFNYIDLSNKLIIFSIFIENIDKIDIIRFSLRVGGTNWVNSLVEEHHIDTFRRDLQNGWNYFVINSVNLAPTGTATYDQINSVSGIRISLSGNTEIGASITVDSVFLVDKPKQKPIFTITFDDGCASDYTIARKIMSKYGYLGTSYIIPSVLGTGRYLTIEQVRTLYEMGWDISNHGYISKMLNVTDEEEWLEDINKGYEWLMNNGFTRSAHHLAYPGGYNTKNIHLPVSKNHKSARLNIGTAETIPASNMYQLHALNGAASMSYVKSNIDKTISRGQWLILMFHEISDEPATPGTDCTPEHFEEIIRYLYEKQAVVLPISQVIK